MNTLTLPACRQGWRGGRVYEKKTGKKIASDWRHIFTFTDGKVAKFREFFDHRTGGRAFRG